MSDEDNYDDDEFVVDEEAQPVEEIATESEATSSKYDDSFLSESNASAGLTQRSQKGQQQPSSSAAITIPPRTGSSISTSGPPRVDTNTSSTPPDWLRVDYLSPTAGSAFPNVTPPPPFGRPSTLSPTAAGAASSSPPLFPNSSQGGVSEEPNSTPVHHRGGTGSFFPTFAVASPGSEGSQSSAGGQSSNNNNDEWQNPSRPTSSNNGETASTPSFQQQQAAISPASYNMTPTVGTSHFFPRFDGANQTPSGSPTDISHFGSAAAASSTSPSNRFARPTNAVGHDLLTVSHDQTNSSYSIGFENAAAMAKESGIILTKIKDPSSRPRSSDAPAVLAPPNQLPVVVSAPLSDRSADPYAEDAPFEEWDESPPATAEPAHSSLPGAGASSPDLAFDPLETKRFHDNESQAQLVDSNPHRYEGDREEEPPFVPDSDHNRYLRYESPVPPLPPDIARQVRDVLTPTNQNYRDMQSQRDNMNDDSVLETREGYDAEERKYPETTLILQSSTLHINPLTVEESRTDLGISNISSASASFSRPGSQLNSPKSHHSMIIPRSNASSTVVSPKGAAAKLVLSPRQNQQHTSLPASAIHSALNSPKASNVTNPASPALSVRHEHHSPRNLFGGKMIISPTTDHALVHREVEQLRSQQASAAGSRAVSRPTSSGSATRALSPASRDRAMLQAISQRADLVTAAQLSGSATVAPLSPSQQLLRNLSQQTAAAQAKSNQAQLQMESKAERASQAAQLLELNKPHREAILAQLPDSHFAPEPRSERDANLPRFLQSSRAAPVWISRAPFAVLEQNANKAFNPRLMQGVPRLSYSSPSEKFQSASAKFKSFLNKENGIRTQNQFQSKQPTRFSAMDAAQRKQLADLSGAGNDQPSLPYNGELIANELSDRARQHVFKALPLGHSDIHANVLPSRRHTGVHETAGSQEPSSAAKQHSSFINRYSANEIAKRLDAHSLSSQGKKYTVAAVSAPPVGTGIARVQEAAHQQLQRVYLLKLAFRSREAEQAAVRQTLLDSAEDDVRMNAYRAESAAILHALERREAAERARILSGEPEWSAPDTQEEDAGFYSAWDRERNARAAIQRAVKREGFVTADLEARILARGPDAESDIGEPLDSLSELDGFEREVNEAVPVNDPPPVQIDQARADEYELKYTVPELEEGAVDVSNWSPGRV